MTTYLQCMDHVVLSAEDCPLCVITQLKAENAELQATFLAYVTESASDKTIDVAEIATLRQKVSDAEEWAQLRCSVFADAAEDATGVQRDGEDSDWPWAFWNYLRRRTGERACGRR